MKNAASEPKLMNRSLLYAMAGVLVVVVIGWFGWKILANNVQARFDTQVERLASQGKNLECDEQRIGGFPFRIGLFCDGISYEDKAGGVLVKAGNLRSAAQFYQPGFVVGELDSPALLQMPGMVDMKLDWKLARSSSRITPAGIQRVSLKIEEVNASGVNGIVKDRPLANMKRVELHLRPGGDNTASPDVEAVIDSDGVRFGNGAGGLLPPLAFKVDGIIYGMNEALNGGLDIGRWIRSNGLKLQVHNIEIGMESGGSLTGKGPLQIDKAGLLNGNLEIEITEIQKMVDNFSAQNPQLGNIARAVQAASLMFAQTGSDGRIRLKIQFIRGAITMGFFPLGSIPRFF